MNETPKLINIFVHKLTYVLNNLICVMVEVVRTSETSVYIPKSCHAVTFPLTPLVIVCFNNSRNKNAENIVIVLQLRNYKMLMTGQFTVIFLQNHTNTYLS
jgi:hypothetical protein